MSTVTIRLNQEEEVFFKSYAQLTGQSLSSLLRKLWSVILKMSMI